MGNKNSTLTDVQKELMASNVFQNTSTTTATNTQGALFGHNHTSGYVPAQTYTTTPQTYTTSSGAVNPSPEVTEYLEEVDEIAKMLGVPPGGTGIMVRGKDGNDYSLLQIIKAHIDLMMQLNIFASKKGN